MNARCWETFKGKLYFGTGAGQVMQADTGGADGDASISGLVRSAYNYLQSPYDKQFRLLRAHIESGAAGSQVQVGASVDFDRDVPVLTPGSDHDRQARRGIHSALGTHLSGVPGWDASGTGAASTSRERRSASTFRASRARIRVSWFSSDVVYDQVTGAIANTG